MCPFQNKAQNHQSSLISHYVIVFWQLSWWVYHNKAGKNVSSIKCEASWKWKNKIQTFQKLHWSRHFDIFGQLFVHQYIITKVIVWKATKLALPLAYFKCLFASTIRYCPWCEDPDLETGFPSGCCRDTRRNIYVIDDRLYDYIESFPRTPYSRWGPAVWRNESSPKWN